jgi:predicted DNA-binding transcriptional regulator AlpA
MHPGGFLRVEQVLALVPVSRSTLDKRVAAGTFPQPVRLSGRIRLWPCEAVRAWLDDLRRNPRSVDEAAEGTRPAREAMAELRRTQPRGAPAAAGK